MRRTRPTFHPLLERLENRWCPAVTLKQSGDELRIKGDSLDHTVEIVAQADGSLLVTTESGVATFRKVHDLEINLKGGNDTLTIDLTAAPRMQGEIEANMALGDDTVTIDLGVTGGSDEVEIDVNLG